MNRISAAALTALVVFGSMAVRADTPLPGLYSVTTATTWDLPIPAPSHTLTHCLTEDDFERDPMSFLGSPEGASNCEVIEFTMDDGILTLSMSCSSAAGEMIMTTQGGYDATSYNVTSDIEMSGAGMTMNMTTTGTGQRVGDC